MRPYRDEPEDGQRPGPGRSGRSVDNDEAVIDAEDEAQSVIGTDHGPENDAQLQQDIDAARQMSRARAHSDAMRIMEVASPSTPRLATHHEASPISVPGAQPDAPGGHSDAIYGRSMHNRYSTSPEHRIGSPAAAARYSTSPLAHRHQSGFELHDHEAHFGASHPHQAHVAAGGAARFYQQHRRNGSNTSLDSANHFIDHRNQPHSLTPSSFLARRPRESQLGGERSSLARHSPMTLRPSAADERDDLDGSEAPGSGTLEHDDHTLLVDVQEAQRPDHDFNGPGLGPAMMDRSANSPRQVNQVSPDTMSRRPSALEDDVCFPMATPHDEGHELGTGPSGPSAAGGIPGPSPGLGRPSRPSGVAHGAPAAPRIDRPPAGFPYTFDLETLEEYAREERRKLALASAAASGAFLDGGAAGQGWGLRSRGILGRDVRARGEDDVVRQGGGVRGSFSGAAGAPYGMSPDSDEATFYSRRPKRMGPGGAFAAAEAGEATLVGRAGGAMAKDILDANGAGGGGTAGARNRYQRKLALFEGAGGATSPPPPVGARAHTIANSQSIFGNDSLGAKAEELAGRSSIDGKGGAPGGARRKLGAPGGPDPTVGRSFSVGGGLLDAAASSGKNRRRSVAGYNAPNVSMPTTAGGAGSRSVSAADSPYRFTFYSNALPSTIHARYLSEIPAPGQTFEELLMGLEPGVLQPTPPNLMDDEPEEESGDQDAKTVDAGTQREHPSTSAAAPSSALAAQLAMGGRVEGTTAPPTGANTPELPGPQAPRATQGRTSAATAAAPSGGGASASAAAPPRPAAGGAGSGENHFHRVPTMDTQYRMHAQPHDVAEANTWWLDVLSPTDQEMKLLSRVFGIHPLTTEDILLEETREKIELFRNYYLVCFRSFDQDPYSPTYLEPLNCYIVVFREGTLSFHFRATPHPMNVRRRIKQLKDYINVTSDWISYALIDDITDAFAPLIQSIEYEVDAIDELVLILKEAEQSDMLRRIGTCRKKVMGLLRLMGNKADVVKGLAKRSNEQWSVAPKSDIGLYLSDIQDHLLTSVQNLTHFEAILSRSHSTYLAQISIEMTDANNQINDVLSKLTALGTVIVPMNVITGLWGMNVNVPWQGKESLVPFGGIVAVMGVLAIAGYIATVRYLSK